jgi:hypothetical protein
MKLLSRSRARWHTSHTTVAVIRCVAFRVMEGRHYINVLVLRLPPFRMAFVCHFVALSNCLTWQTLRSFVEPLGCSGRVPIQARACLVLQCLDHDQEEKCQILVAVLYVRIRCIKNLVRQSLIRVITSPTSCTCNLYL